MLRGKIYSVILSSRSVVLNMCIFMIESLTFDFKNERKKKGKVVESVANCHDTQTHRRLPHFGFSTMNCCRRGKNNCALALLNAS